MMLKEWLRLTRTRQIDFAARLRLNQATVSKIINKGTNSLRIAARITKETKGAVTVLELLPPENSP